MISQPEVIVPPEVTPRSPEVTAQPEGNTSTSSQAPEVTARPEVISQPEVTAQPEGNTSTSSQAPEVTARAEVKKCALLYNGIIRLYICSGCGTLTLVVPLCDKFQQRMRIK